MVVIGSLFLEGLLSFFSPCVLPLVPLYLGYLTQDAKEVDLDGKVTYKRKKTLWLTFGFVLGICTVFIIAGIGSEVIRHFFNQYRLYFLLFGGFLFILFGLFQLHIISIPLLDKTYQKQISPKGSMTFLKAYLLGFFFSFAWSPCIGPMLAQAIVLSSGVSRVLGWVYIGAYMLGFIVIFILLGFFTTYILEWLKKIKNIVKYSTVVSGIVILAMAGYMFYLSSQEIHALTTNSQNDLSNGEAVSESTNEDMKDIEKYNITLMGSDGKEHSLTDYQGKPILLMFYATWCQYCNQELDHLMDIMENEKDVELIMVLAPNYSGEKSIEEIDEIMKEKGCNFLRLYDESLNALRTYGVNSYPMTFVFNKTGDVLGYIPGYVPYENLLEVIEEAKTR